MDIALAVLCGIFLLVSILGSILPALPGPPLAWVGILILHFTTYANFSTRFLLAFTGIMVVVTALDYLIPIWGTKRFGGTRAGVIGSTVGLVVGLFFGPMGIIAGPFLGALVGELIARPNELRSALRSATGSFVGFLLGTGLKLIFCGYAVWVFVKVMVNA